MEHEDTQQETQEAETADEEEFPVIDATGQPFHAETTVPDLVQGVDMESETPEEAAKEDSPTPNRQMGRMTP
jgi:hypothetical protein